MVLPQRAPVRPRVIAPASGETVLLEDEVTRLIQVRARGVFALRGLSGAGKTVALRHLAAVLPPCASVALVDAGDDLCDGRSRADLVVCAAEAARESPVDGLYRLAAWGPDDWIEYLLATHPRCCASVMARVRPQDRLLLGDAPELWAAILDCLAAEDAIPDARRALHRIIQGHLLDTDLLERSRSACLNAVLGGPNGLVGLMSALAQPDFPPGLLRLLHFPPVFVLLAAERIVADLHGDAACDFLVHRLSRDLVAAVAHLAANDVTAREHLLRLLAGPDWSHPMAASLLHAMDASWVPSQEALPNLTGAYLDGAVWPGAALAGAKLTAADLGGANLHGVILVGADLAGANLAGACLRLARLENMVATSADLMGADLSDAALEAARLGSALLSGANLCGAKLCGADLTGADVTGANFAGADLQTATLKGATVEGADFSGADLSHACLTGVRLSGARWEGARFAGAHLEHADLEGLLLPHAELQGAILEGALLTATTMPGADFRGADLRKAGLADVDWEGADLRGADLRGASFHLGSSRNGLVGSPIACEGSRTGFYTDDYDDRTYKAPEEIRKANLCGADLRGAKIDGVDFYLVDLRGVLCDPDQEAHLRGCGAILGA